MNAMARKELGKQAVPGQIASQTTDVDIFELIPFLGRDDSKLVNFVDMPGLQDTEGRDQAILDNMVEQLREKFQTIDMFVLCFEKGKFDQGIQGMMQTYMRLLNDKEKIWQNMTAVITKVGWDSEEHDELKEWIEEMDNWENNLKTEFSKRYEGAEPSILVISQDITRKKRKENKEGTEQEKLMVEKME